MVGTAVYKAVTSAAERFVPEKLKPFWNHPAGIFKRIAPYNIHVLLNSLLLDYN